MIFQDYKDLVGYTEATILGKKRKLPYDYRKLFSAVYHITHVPASKYLLETKCIIPQLIHDKSKLNTERIQVIWLSPNEWYQGSLYGNVRFSYDFTKMIFGKKFYAVEVMTDYNPTACRILITDKDYTSNALLEEYNPHILNNGPWYIDPDGNNFYHKDYNIEFMFEDQLSLNDAIKVDFVKHHPDLCNIYDNRTCPYLGFTGETAENVFVSYLISNNIQLRNLKLHLSKSESTWSLLDIALSFEKIAGLITNNVFEGTSTLSSETKKQLARSILDLVAKQDYNSANTLTKVFSSKEELIKCIRMLFGEYFKVDESKLSSSKIDNV